MADGAADDNLPDATPDDTTDKKPAADELLKRALIAAGEITDSDHAAVRVPLLQV